MKKLNNILILLCSIVMAMFIGFIGTGGDVMATFIAAGVIFFGGIALSLSLTPASRRGMAFACGSISAALSLSCTVRLSGGVNPNVWIANKDDIASWTTNVSNPYIVESITMGTLKEFYKWEGKLKSTEPAVRVIKGNYDNTWEHEIKIRVFDISPAILQQIANMKDGRFVVIVENNSKGTAGNTKYDIYGLDNGLYCEAIERIPQSADDAGAWNVTLKTQEYGRETKPTSRLFITDEAATDAVIAGLV